MKPEDKNQNDQPDNTTPPENHGNFLFSRQKDPIKDEVRRQQELMNQENRLKKDSLTPDESSKKSNH